MTNRWPEIALCVSWLVVIVLAYYLTTKEYHPMSFFTKDVLERAGWTFLQAIVAYLAVSDFTLGWKVLAAGAVGAGLSAVKSLLGQRVGDPGDASFVSGTPNP